MKGKKPTRSTADPKESALANPNRYGAPSEMRIHISKGEKRSITSELSFTAPFKLTHPFYDDEDRLILMLLSVSAGIMAGDDQHVEITVDSDAEALVMSQAFEKIHKMAKGRFASRKTLLNIAAGGRLLYEPLPVIPFAESAFINETEIRLEDASSDLFYCEVISCGRVASNERFQFQRFCSKVHVHIGDELSYWDNLVLIPQEMREHAIDPESFCLLEGNTHQATILMHRKDFGEDCEEQIAEIIESADDCEGGVSRNGDGIICVRVLANGSEPILDLRDEIKEALDWQLAGPATPVGR